MLHKLKEKELSPVLGKPASQPSPTLCSNCSFEEQHASFFT